MRVKHEQIPNTIKFLQIDFPALVLQTAGIEDKDEYWQQVIEQIHIVSEKYNNNGFVDHMLTAYADYLDRMYRKAKTLNKEKANEQNERV
mgnify:CR=1 FL=1|nr:MAG TPA: hypothetical protein [Caudoviricetes sp.]DAG26882.1 MAG TPA: hypothetical protein [Bacteriophage sp.]DAN01919.1 MAG TPA: hypothetical protein [Caudoviricetes sp.]